MLASVIIAALNAEDYLGAAVHSVTSQSVTDLEVIIVDDGSDDGTHDIIAALASQDGRIIHLQHPTRQGVSAARNKALSVARGEWVAILDADDRFEPNRLEILISQAASRGLDIVADNLRVINYSDGANLGLAFPTEWLSSSALVDLSFLVEHDWPGRHDGRGLGFLKPVLRRDFLVETGIVYDKSVVIAEDLLLLATSLIRGAKLGLTVEALYLYSARAGSVSTNRSHAREIVRVNTLICNQLNCERISSLNLKSRGRAFMYQAFTGYVKERDIRGAVGCAAGLPLGYLLSRLARAARGQFRRLTA